MKVEEIKLAFNTNVQFAISEDLKVFGGGVKNRTAALQKLITAYENAYVQMKNASSEVIKNNPILGKVLVNAENGAKDLGVAVGSIPGYNDALQSWKEAETAIAKYNSF